MQAANSREPPEDGGFNELTGLMKKHFSIRLKLTISFIMLSIVPLCLLGAVISLYGFWEHKEQLVELQEELTTQIANSMLIYLEEQEHRYGLGHTISEPRQAFEKAVEMLGKGDLKSEWQEKRKKLLEEKMDVTAFVTEFVDNWPDSFLNHKNAEP